MSVNGVTGSNTDMYKAYSGSAAGTAKDSSSSKTSSEAQSKPGSDTGAVYEPSDKKAGTYKPDTALINKLKADSEARLSQIQTLVCDMISKQGSTLGQSDSIWSFLADGNFSVDPAVKAQAQADIAQDGYWGVSQTSDRIIDFAKALTGGDPAKIESMRAAFEKGFKQATATWGKALPDISQKTYTAVMDKFDAWASESAPKTEE